jgi:hypothetical protein
MTNILSSIAISNIWTDVKSTVLGAAVGGLTLLAQDLTSGSIDWKGIASAVVLTLVGGLVNLFKQQISTGTTSSPSGTV